MAAAFALFGLGWFFAVWRRLGTGPLAYFFLHENLERFAGETYDTGRSPAYYLWAFLAVGLPWSLMFPVAAARTWRDTRWLLLWMAAMAVPLSLARGKIDYYLLPLLPAASLVVGRYVAATAWTAVDRLWARCVLVVAAIGFAGLPAVESRLPVEWLPSATAQVLFVLVVAGAALGAGLAAARPTQRRLVGALAGGTSAVALVAVGLFLPAFRARQPNAEVVADVARELAYRPDAHVVVCGDPTRARRDLLFGVRVAAQERCDVWSPASSRIAFLMLVQKEQRLSLASVPGLREVAEYRGLPATALTLGGLLAGLEPEPFVLLANYPTTDPVAETKRKRDRKRALRAEETAAGVDQDSN
jgi:4-amino-4-deoxy-L-arabinose transferase-like glycosyltransferase